MLIFVEIWRTCVSSFGEIRTTFEKQPWRSKVGVSVHLPRSFQRLTRFASGQILPPPLPLQFLPQHVKEPTSRSHGADQVAQLRFVELKSPASAHFMP